MPVYDGDETQYLEQAIESILCQTYKNIEFVIVMDGIKREDLKTVIYDYKKANRNIVVDELPENKGIVQALNRGIALSGGEYLVRMDADDISYPERVEKLISFLENNPKVCFIGSFLYEIDESGKKILFAHQYPTEWKKIVSLLPWRVPFAHPSCAFRKAFFQRIGKYTGKYFQNEDYEIWFKAYYRNLCGTNIPEYLYKERFGRNKYGRRRGLKLALSEFRVKRNYLRPPYFPRHVTISPYIAFCFRMLPASITKFCYKNLR